MSSIYTKVSRVADWAGWCSPCEREDRPLVLTRSGPGGVGAWMAGLNDDDRLLLLTCRVCGNWQYVPAREEDDPEVVLVDDDVLETVAEMVYDARSTVAPVELDIVTPSRLPAARHDVPAPPLPPLSQQPVEQSVDASVEALLATFGRAPVAEAPVPSEPLPVDVPASFLLPQDGSTDEPVLEAPVVEAPVAAVPAAEVPEPRVAVERVVTVPEPESAATSGFSAEAVAAAAALLSAARAGSAPSSAADRRKETQDRRHRARRGPTPRRSSDRVAAVRSAAAEAAAVPALELPPVLGLPSGTRQVVLAAAS